MAFCILRYQLAGTNQHSQPASAFASPRYVIPNLTRYLFEPPRLSTTFPFIQARNFLSRSWIDKSSQGRPVRGFDWLVGLAWTQPFLLFSLVALKNIRRKSTPADPNDPRDRFGGKWLATCLVFAGVLAFLPALAVNGSAIRYLTDAVPCLALLAAMGYFWCLTYIQTWRRPLQFGVGLLILVQSLIGILLAIKGPTETFASANPDLYFALKSFFQNL